MITFEFLMRKKSRLGKVQDAIFLSFNDEQIWTILKSEVGKAKIIVRDMTGVKT